MYNNNFVYHTTQLTVFELQSSRSEPSGSSGDIRQRVGQFAYIPTTTTFTTKLHMKNIHQIYFHFLTKYKIIICKISACHGISIKMFYAEILRRV